MEATILVLVYNHENYIKKCLDNVFNQVGIEKYNIIINDDASTDKTANIIQKYIDDLKNDNITYIRRVKNVGAKTSFLEMLNLVETDYISVIEGDDYWIDNRKIIDQIEMLDANNKLSFVHGKSIIVDKNNSMVGNMHVAGEVNLDMFLKKNNIPLNTMMFRNYKELFDEKYYCSDIICDIPLKILLLTKGNSALLDRNVTAYRHITDEGSSFSAMQSDYQNEQSYLALSGMKDICGNNIYYKRWISEFLISSGRKNEFKKLLSNLTFSEKVIVYRHLIYIRLPLIQRFKSIFNIKSKLINA